jgi:hypothetical protein
VQWETKVVYAKKIRSRKRGAKGQKAQIF